MPDRTSTAPRAAGSWLRRGAAALAIGLPLFAAIAAYSGSLHGELLFDDVRSIGPDSAIGRGDWWAAAFQRPQQSLSNRPLACFTLAITPAAGTDTTNHRIVSLVLHCLTALLLAAVIRRTLRTPNVVTRTGQLATPAAIAIATVWACHPFGVDAVVYPTQRSMVLAGLAFFAAVYGVLRAAGSPHPQRWRTLTVLALAAGMASKEELVAAPVLMVLFQRAFLFPDWRSMRGEARFHGAMAATWGVLAACVAAGPPNNTVGYDAIVTVGPVEWLTTQSFVLLHYVANTVCPVDLRPAYDTAVVRDVATAWPALASFGIAFVATAWQWRRRPWIGWLGALFFLLLGPTSSVMPIVTEPVADRRMYVPMLAILTPLTIAALVGFRRVTNGLSARSRLGLAACIAAVVLGVAIATTRRHAAAYRDQVTLWTAAFHANDLDNGSLPASMILASYARALRDQGRDDEALPLLERAMQAEHTSDVPLQLAEVAWQRGDLARSEQVLRALLAEEPRNARCFSNLASLLLTKHQSARTSGTARADDPELAEAVRFARLAFEKRREPRELASIALGLFWQGDLAEAETMMRRAIREGADSPPARHGLAQILAARGRHAEAKTLLQALVARQPDDVAARWDLARVLRDLGDVDGAVANARAVLAIDARHPEANRLVRELAAAPR